ncbi:MAG: Uma2 family endonuclease [Coleofasciculaceae cyanobacterium SM2_3_26]|nr:Uma2 family endonuclease [Coleofasciculaceae cyanobacterium SM2_3_26]
MVPTTPALTRRLGRLESIEPQMESLQHADQLSLLYECLKQWQAERHAFVGRNMTLLFDPEQLRNRNFLGPDLFAVLDPLPADPIDRSTWVVWEEGYRFPDAIIELLSESTAQSDRSTKKQIYQNTFKTREYFYYAPLKTKTTEYQEFAGFRLVDGEYQPIEPNEQGWLWSEVFGMYLGVCRRDLPLSRYRERSPIGICCGSSQPTERRCCIQRNERDYKRCGLTGLKWSAIANGWRTNG